MHCASPGSSRRGCRSYNDGRSEQLVIVLAGFLNLDFLLGRFLQFILAAFDQLVALLMSVSCRNSAETKKRIPSMRPCAKTACRSYGMDTA